MKNRLSDNVGGVKYFFERTTTPRHLNFAVWVGAIFSYHRSARPI
jgi:hypothetical protein